MRKIVVMGSVWRSGANGDDFMDDGTVSDMNNEQKQENNTKMYWLHALTPLHVGAGRGVGFIDLPIMREKVTNWPLVPGLSLIHI